ncbi:MAG: EamA family transporter [candidate division Zixibacteria bacterium]|nr:EamA family transporter [candidate division Zixibacteria bacterium]
MYVLLCLIWGSTWIAIKIGLTAAPPLQTAALRFMLATLILNGVIFLMRYPYPRDIRSWLRVGYPGIWMYGVNYALIYFAQVFISSSLTAVLFASLPFFVAVLSTFRLNDARVTPAGWIGIALGFVGVALISYDQLQTGDDLFLGTILAVVATYSAAHGLIIHKKFHAGANIVVTASIQMLLGSMLVLLSAIIFEDWADFHVTAASIGSILYLALMGTIVAFLSYYWLLARMSALSASLIAFITPLVALFIGVVFFDETVSASIVIGTTLILSGVGLSIERKRKAEPRTVQPVSTP